MLGGTDPIIMFSSAPLSQLFAEGNTHVSLTESQRKLLERWSRLSEDQQAVVFALIDKM